MTKELARYFVKLIAEDLRLSFNGMGIPSYSCEWLENQLIQENYDKVKEFIQKRYDEHENSAKDTNVHGKKRKHKLRAITNGERGKEMTNFEKIKEKNIEEMAKFLISFYFDVSVNSAKYTNMEKWLQSEVEE